MTEFAGNPLFLLAGISSLVTLFVLVLSRPELSLPILATCYFFTNLPVPYIGSPEKLLSVILLCACIVRGAFGRGTYGENRRLLFAFLLFLGAMLGSAMTSELPVADTFTAIQGIATKGLLVLLIYQIIQTKNDLYSALKAFAVVVCVGIFLNVLLMFHYKDPFILQHCGVLTQSGTEEAFEKVHVWANDPVFSFVSWTLLSNPNHFSRAIVTILPMVYALTHRVKHGAARGGLIVLFFGGALVVCMSLSRTGVLGLVLVMCYLAYKRRGVLAKAVLVAMVLATVSFVILEGPMRDRFQTLSPEAVTDDTRYVLTWAALNSFEENPVLGTGPGSNPSQMKDLVGHLLPLSEDLEVHNTYLSVLVEEGILGLTALVLLLYFFIQKLRRMERSMSDEHDAMLLRAFEASFIFVFAAGFTANILHSNIYWILAGIALSLEKFSVRARVPRL